MASAKVCNIPNKTTSEFQPCLMLQAARAPGPEKRRAFRAAVAAAAAV
eukprot:CAMPEP_0172691638 /NCGR_PEP_ID=MMETSP1074-20121228/24696_1 /TAXON_ID=2916 /ORGANISM="Ceratium fusus, Strain PA161109" /LENGTH=47 /DNA_ID= /DNA_START= /DNA_END= /DNA_ORIENTATION=